MNTKTQELVTAGFALAKGLDAEHAKLVKELATELAVQRVRADELNKQVVNLAVECSGLKSLADLYGEAWDDLFSQCCSNPVTNEWGEPVDFSLVNKAREQSSLKTSATDTFLTSIKLLGVDAFAAWCDEKVEFMSTQNIHDDAHLSASQSAKEYAAQLRKEASNDQ